MVRSLGNNHAAVRRFRTTRWSLVAAAAELTPGTRAALAELCELYWPPVYTFVRRSRHDPQDALDLTQSFFARILEHNNLASTDPQRGRFRNWLLAALKHFLANEWRRARAQKRGGGVTVLSIGATDDDSRHAHDPADSLTPEHMYERRWALTLLDHVMETLEREYATQGKREWFEQLKSHLVGDEPSYEALARKLGKASGTLRVQVHRLRRRFRDLLRAEITGTVEAADDVDDELRNLFAALS